MPDPLGILENELTMVGYEYEIKDTNKEMNMLTKTFQFEPKLTDLRVDEYNSYAETADDGSEFIIAYSTKSYSRMEAIINISRTSFICIVLSFASILFTKDAQSLVLDPLERMIEKVKLMA